MVVNGLLIGKVIELQNDPQGANRILIKIPALDSKASVWARVATFDAGGAFFRPEIDDEVIVGFINADSKDVVVLGVLRNKTKPLPIPLKNTNHEKAIVTRSNLRVHFNDDTKMISIDTPAGNSIVLDETGKNVIIKDQNSNTLTMSPGGIKIESKTSITIKAGMNLTLSAGAALSITGVNVSMDARGPLQVKGVDTTLSATGTTQVRGSLVKIN